LNVAKKAYLFHSEHFALHETSSFEKPFLLEIRLIPIPETAKIPDSDLITNAVVLKNVFFETGSAALLKNSRIELDKLRDFLLQNPGIKIQINGHTDNQGSDEDNLLLSENRAGAVFDYLVQSGIMKERLKYKGFGEQLPIADNATAEGRQQNRRTDFVIIP
jgi:outer membrane protein OmpA-like peptidoglycan-associated protein